MMSVRLLAAALERCGRSPAAYLAELGFSDASLQDVHARISLTDYRRAVCTALARSGDPALGLHMGEHVDLGAYDVLGYLTMQSSCLREALTVAQRYTRIVKDGPQLELRETADSASVRIHFCDGDAPEQRLTAEFAQLAMLSMMRRYVGENAQPLRVLFAHQIPTHPVHRAEYTRLFAGREHFAQAYTGIDIPCSWLGRSQVCCSNDLRSWLEVRANQLLARAEQAVSTADRVRGRLNAHGHRALPTMEEVADDLGMSSRTLRRHLNAELVKFDDLADEALADRAKHMLSNPACSVQEVAYEMGFQTPSAFSRAFKRWTGAAPSTFRQSALSCMR